MAMAGSSSNDSDSRHGCLVSLVMAGNKRLPCLARESSTTIYIFDMPQHLHIPLNIFWRPTRMSRHGQTTPTKPALTTFKAWSKNAKPMSTMRPGTTLWCGHLHPPQCPMPGAHFIPSSIDERVNE